MSKLQDVCGTGDCRGKVKTPKSYIFREVWFWAYS